MRKVDGECAKHRQQDYRFVLHGRNLRVVRQPDAACVISWARMLAPVWRRSSHAGLGGHFIQGSGNVNARRAESVSFNEGNDCATRGDHPRGEENRQIRGISLIWLF
jgi:hypothetical protein